METKVKTIMLKCMATLLVGALALACMFPFLWMVSASFKNEEER